mmetsp:Transcript_910/g.2063  ORF Transcript_910/g.2063 Transcript_910/m.2063 type:complete len:102 (+) Transcript_910:360-665(+)
MQRGRSQKIGSSMMMTLLNGGCLPQNQPPKSYNQLRRTLKQHQLLSWYPIVANRAMVFTGERFQLYDIWGRLRKISRLEQGKKVQELHNVHIIYKHVAGDW